MSLLAIPPGVPDLRAIVDWLEPIVPASALAATPQDHTFHAEGDVWTHTRLAIEALVTGDAYAAAAPEIRSILAAAVLLHDIGKPSSTRLDGDKLTARGHSARGESLARVALWRLGVPVCVREHVCALVRHHQVPAFGITKPAADAAQLAIRLSLVTRNDWLTVVADADARGRRCANPADHTRIVEHIARWGEHCKGLGVHDRPRVFPTAHTRRVWLESEIGARPPDVLAPDDTVCEVILMSGLPASGKDTWLRENRPGLPVISLDELRTHLEVEPEDAQSRVIAAAREQARTYLRTHTSFAWNATNLSPLLREQLIDLFRSYRARAHIVYCEASVHEQAARNRSRATPVPPVVIDRMLARWTVPDPTEAHEVTYVLGAAPGTLTWPPTVDPRALVKS